jgi:MFS family permease
MNSRSPDFPKASNREWVGLAVLALPCLLYSMDLTVLNLAVPKLSAALRPTSTELLWIVDIYGFVLAGALIPMGVLGARLAHPAAAVDGRQLIQEGLQRRLRRARHAHAECLPTGWTDDPPFLGIRALLGGARPRI